MRVALAQMRVVEGEMGRNIAMARELAAEAARAGARVVAFPELFFSGYDWEYIRRVDDEETRRSIKALQTLAAPGMTVIAGSIAARRWGGVRNTTYVVKLNELPRPVYSKIHLFSLMGEERAFVAGSRTAAIDLDRWRAGIATCYDLRFPEMFRRLTYRHDTTIFFVQSAWPMPRQSAWDLLLRARAIENQVYVCGTNRVGDSGPLDYFGSTQVVGPLGEVIANAGRTEGLLIAEIDLAEVRRVRETLPVLNDRRPDVYGPC